MNFDDLENFDAEDSVISMFDDEGNESAYHMLAAKNLDGFLYMLAEADDEEAEVSEVLIFRCADAEAEDMVFELIDEEHESFETAFSLFKEDMDKHGIEY